MIGRWVLSLLIVGGSLYAGFGYLTPEARAWRQLCAYQPHQAGDTFSAKEQQLMLQLKAYVYSVDELNQKCGT